MTPTERQHLYKILEEHHAMAQQFHIGQEAFTGAFAALGTAQRVTLDAIARLILANEAAIKLIENMQQGG
jgi:hypothetical protein